MTTADCYVYLKCTCPIFSFAGEVFGTHKMLLSNLKCSISQYWHMTLKSFSFTQWRNQDEAQCCGGYRSVRLCGMTSFLDDGCEQWIVDSVLHIVCKWWCLYDVRSDSIAQFLWAQYALIVNGKRRQNGFSSVCYNLLAMWQYIWYFQVYRMDGNVGMLTFWQWQHWLALLIGVVSW